MQVLPVDLTAIVGIVMGMLVILIPIAGFTARFALRPIAEAMARVKESQQAGRELEMVRQRLDLLEQRLSGLDSEVERLAEAHDFQAKLQSPRE